MATVTAGVFLVQAAGAAVLPGILVDRYGDPRAAAPTGASARVAVMGTATTAAVVANADVSWDGSPLPAQAAVLLGALRFVPARTPDARHSPTATASVRLR